MRWKKKTHIVRKENAAKGLPIGTHSEGYIGSVYHPKKAKLINHLHANPCKYIVMITLVFKKNPY